MNFLAAAHRRGSTQWKHAARCPPFPRVDLPSGTRAWLQVYSGVDTNRANTNSTRRASAVGAE